jgi:integrase-like protein
VRFHDGRHTALTRLAEAGQADWVIQAQLGHVSPAMMKTYSHIRRKALDAAAAALEPPRTEQPDGAMDGVGLELRILAPISGLSNVAQHEPSALR